MYKSYALKPKKSNLNKLNALNYMWYNIIARMDFSWNNIAIYNHSNSVMPT